MWGGRVYCICMSEKIIGLLVWLIGSGVRGYASVVVLMAIQSACIPIPSEVIMRWRAWRWCIRWG